MASLDRFMKLRSKYDAVLKEKRQQKEARKRLSDLLADSTKDDIEQQKNLLQEMSGLLVSYLTDIDMNYPKLMHQMMKMGPGTQSSTFSFRER